MGNESIGMTDMDGRHVRVTAKEFFETLKQPSVQAMQSGDVAAVLPSVREERGDTLRGLCGVRVSLGGLRLSKEIVVRAEDRFNVVGFSNAANIDVKPEDLFPVNIFGDGRVFKHDHYNQPMFGFQLPAGFEEHATISLVHTSPGYVSRYVLGDVFDAVVLDEEGNKWVVLEPLVVPSPKSRFPSEEELIVKRLQQK